MTERKERPSDRKVYSHNLEVGTPVWRSPETGVEEVTVYTSKPWTVHVRGADRRDADSVRALIGRIRDGAEDQGFRPGDTVYVAQGALVKRTKEKRLLSELDKELRVTDVIIQPVGEIFQQAQLPGFDRRLHEQGISDFTDLKGKK